MWLVIKISNLLGVDLEKAYSKGADLKCKDLYIYE